MDVTDILLFISFLTCIKIGIFILVDFDCWPNRSMAKLGNVRIIFLFFEILSNSMQFEIVRCELQ